MSDPDTDHYWYSENEIRDVARQQAHWNYILSDLSWYLPMAMSDDKVVDGLAKWLLSDKGPDFREPLVNALYDVSAKDFQDYLDDDYD